VSAFEGHALVQFDMLLDVEFAGEILHADVVHVQVVPGATARIRQDIFRPLGARQWLHSDVGVGRMPRTAAVTASTNCSERWKVTVRAKPTARSAK